MAMPTRWWKRAGTLFLVSALVGSLAPSTRAGEGGCGCGCGLHGLFSCMGLCGPHCCRPKCPPYGCEFYGYYSTCWHYWPAGWRSCPPGGPAVVVPGGAPAAPAGEKPAPEQNMPKLTRESSVPAGREATAPRTGTLSFEPVSAPEPPALPTVINGSGRETASFARPVIIPPGMESGR